MSAIFWPGPSITERGSEAYTPPPVRSQSPTLEKLIAEGRGGVMSGAGFYDYGGRPADELFRARDIELLQLKRALEAIEKRRTK